MSTLQEEINKRRMGWQLNLPYVPRSDFLKNVKPEG